MFILRSLFLRKQEAGGRYSTFLFLVVTMSRLEYPLKTCLERMPQTIMFCQVFVHPSIICSDADTGSKGLADAPTQERFRLSAVRQ